MEENLEKNNFEMTVPYNNEVLVADRKKTKLTGGIFLVVTALIMLALAIGCAVSGGETWEILLFAIFTVLLLTGAIAMFCTIKPSKRNENKVFKFLFHDDGLQVVQQNGLTDPKARMIENCLYRRYQNKQFVASITEKDDRIIISIYTGTINGAPQYKKHSIPKSILSDEELTNLIDFLKEKVGSDYKVKIKNKSDLENLTNAN